MQDLKYDDLEEIYKKLVDEAAKAMEKAYNPYSHFYVGAAILSEDGQIITGANVENAAYGSSICAERSALVRANAMGLRNFDKIAIITRGDDFDSLDVASPCGSCRQMFFEFSQAYGKDLEVIMSSTKKDKIIVTSISKLLPFGFGPRDVGV